MRMGILLQDVCEQPRQSPNIVARPTRGSAARRDVRSEDQGSPGNLTGRVRPRL